MLKRLLIVLSMIVLAGCSLPAGNWSGEPGTPQIDPTLTLTSPALTPTEAYLPPEHLIQVRVVDGEGEFYNTITGETFIPRGVNYILIVDTGTGLENRVFEVGRYQHEVFAADLQGLVERGYNTVRLFLECSSDTTCITDPATGRLNGEYLDNLVDAMHTARDAGIFLLLTSNDLPTKGEYWNISNRQAERDPNFEGYRNAHILTENGHQAAVAYWTDLMSGLAERQAPWDAVLAWSLLNEQWLFKEQPPLSLDAGVVETANGLNYDLSDPAQKRAMVAENLLLYIDQVEDVIRTYDPTTLVTMGFFAPQFPNETGIGGSWYVDTAALIEGGAALDFYDFHAYPGDDLTLAEFAENFGMTGHPEIPVVMGEYGAFEDRYDSVETAARAATQWAAESCAHGWDGWLYWSYFDLPAPLGDPTWGFVEGDHFMLDLFAPNAQPDICTPVEVPTANLAYGKAVTASRQLPEGPPLDALDESVETSWQSGADAPQWIKIDLGAGHTIAEVRLLVGQWPEGETRHRVYFRQAGTTDNAANWQLAHEFIQPTADLDWLSFSLETPAFNIQYVMVETVSSPSWVSWREIEVFGSAED